MPSCWTVSSTVPAAALTTTHAMSGLPPDAAARPDCCAWIRRAAARTSVGSEQDSHRPSQNLDTPGSSFASRCLHFFVGKTFDFGQQGLVLGAGPIPSPDSLDLARQLAEREARRIHIIDRQLDTEGLAHAQDQQHGEQRMSAQVEEIVVHAHRRLLQQFAPDLDELPLDLGQPGLVWRMHGNLRLAPHRLQNLFRCRELVCDASVVHRRRSSARARASSAALRPTLPGVQRSRDQLLRAEPVRETAVIGSPHPADRMQELLCRLVLPGDGRAARSPA